MVNVNAFYGKRNVYVLILLVILYPFAAGLFMLLYINEILSSFLPDYAQIIVGIIGSWLCVCNMFIGGINAQNQKLL